MCWKVLRLFNHSTKSTIFSLHFSEILLFLRNFAQVHFLLFCDSFPLNYLFFCLYFLNISQIFYSHNQITHFCQRNCYNSHLGTKNRFFCHFSSKNCVFPFLRKIQLFRQKNPYAPWPIGKILPQIDTIQENYYSKFYISRRGFRECFRRKLLSCLCSIHLPN